MLGQSGFMICLGCFKSHHNGLFSVGHGQTDTILGGDGHQSLLYFKSPSRVASVCKSYTEYCTLHSKHRLHVWLDLCGGLERRHVFTRIYLVARTGWDLYCV